MGIRDGCLIGCGCHGECPLPMCAVNGMCLHVTRTLGHVNSYRETFAVLGSNITSMHVISNSVSFVVPATRGTTCGNVRTHNTNSTNEGSRCRLPACRSFIPSDMRPAIATCLMGSALCSVSTNIIKSAVMCLAICRSRSRNICNRCTMPR